MQCVVRKAHVLNNGKMGGLMLDVTGPRARRVTLIYRYIGINSVVCGLSMGLLKH